MKKIILGILLILSLSFTNVNANYESIIIDNELEELFIELGIDELIDAQADKLLETGSIEDDKEFEETFDFELGNLLNELAK